VRSFRSALSFLTVLGGASDPRSSGLKWFPAVGVVLGGLTGGVWWLASQVFSAPVAAALALLTDLALTGMLHFDGLADSADGLLPHLSRERRLQVMHSPEIGAFALTVVGGVLIARHAGLAAQPASVLLLVALMTASRAFIAGVIGAGGMARGEGLGSPFRPAGGMGPVLPGGAVIAAGAVAWLAIGPAGAFAVASAVVVAAGVIGLARRRIGGWTGDVLGASVLMAETFGLLAASL
jgi:adenosylcobinamide-GDP ribazoletransferase